MNEPGGPHPLFLQVHTFYPAYIQDYHRRAGSEEGLSHRQRIANLVKDGYGHIHMFAPALDGHGWNGLLVVSNDAPSQLQWWAENMRGRPLPAVPNLEHEIVKTQIETLRPQVLYLGDPISYSAPFLASLAHRPEVVVGWRAADIPEDVRWEGIDLLLSGLSGIRSHALRLGAREALHFYPGFDPEFLPSFGPLTGEVDVVFCGSVNPSQHRTRAEVLEKVLDASRNPRGGFSLDLRMNGDVRNLSPRLAEANRGALFGLEMYRATRRGKMTIDIRGNIRSGMTLDPVLHAETDLARNETMNMRTFEATGCGVFLLTEHFDNLGEYFRSGWEIETFRSSDELLDKIRFYLRHPGLREAIARRGQERCLRDHSMERRRDELSALLRARMASAGRSNPNSAGVDRTP